MKQQFKVGQKVKLKQHHCWRYKIIACIEEGHTVTGLISEAHEDGSCEINCLRVDGGIILTTDGGYELDQGTTNIATDMIEAV